MSEKVVLPKFDLPGKQIHPAVKLMWTVGGLLLLPMVALGGALWRHHSMEVAEENRKQAEIAAKTAQANAELEAAKARQAEAIAKVALAKAKAEAEIRGEERGRCSGAGAKAAAVAGRHHGGGHHGAGKKDSKTTVARAARTKRKPGGEDRWRQEGGRRRRQVARVVQVVLSRSFSIPGASPTVALASDFRASVERPSDAALKSTENRVTEIVRPRP